MILDGKKTRDELLDEYKREILEKQLDITLAIIMIGEDPASKIYIKNKEKACKSVGINVVKYEYKEDTEENTIINLINNLNLDNTITGIILQSPVPKGIDFNKCSGLIDSKKDVDGFTKDNIYNLYLNNKTILPCTVKGILKLLSEYNINLDGKHVVVVGRGNIVGRPLALALLNKNATVTIAHSHTKNLGSITACADIVISAVGVPHLITSEMVRDGAVVVDVGVSRIDGKIVGDVDFESLKDKCSYITPNPGGVGPMTVASIIDNLIEMSEE